MKHITLISIAILAGSALGSPASHAEPALTGAARQRVAAAGDFGGGFIEMLMTGRDPGPGPFHREGPSALRAFNSPNVDPYGASRHRAMRQPHEMIPTQREIPARYRRQPVAYPGKESAGTIVIDTDEQVSLPRAGRGPGHPLRHRRRPRRLHLAWRPVGQHETRMAGLAAAGGDAQSAAPICRCYMAGGPDNPLGARALYLGSSLYRIHGTNEPYTIGQNVSSGCIRMLNDDVQDLYERVEGRHQGDRHVSRTVKDGRPRNRCSVACISTVRPSRLGCFASEHLRMRRFVDGITIPLMLRCERRMIPEKLQTFRIRIMRN